MSILDFFKLIIDVIKAGYQAATKIPRVTCDVRGVYKARWSPDYFPNESGDTIAEGIEIDTKVEILLDNKGSVDTTLKDAYVVVRSHKKVLGRLEHHLLNRTKEYDQRRIHGIVIEPRRIWGPETIQFRGSLWDIKKPPEDLEAELVIEVVAQRPIRRKINLYL